MKQPIDAGARAAALDPTRSFCVTAPAGSGKTELLSQRVLRLLAQAAQPEEILAITFTRKAAAEMQERILAALQHARIAAEPAAEHKRQTWQLARAALARDAECGWNLLHNPARLRVMTIDGLCASLTRQLPVLSTFGGSVAISDDTAALYRDAVSALLADLEVDSPVADALAELLLHLDNDGERLQRLLIALLANRDQWLRHVGSANRMPSEAALRGQLEDTLQAIVVEALQRATEHLRVYQGDLLPLLDFAGTQMRANAPDHALCQFIGCVDLPDCVPEAAAQWRTLTELLLTSDGEWRKQVNKNQGFPAGDNAAEKKLLKPRKDAMIALLDAMRADAALLDALNALRHLPASHYAPSQWEILRRLLLLLPMAAAHLKVIFQQRAEVDYTEVAQAALHALGDADDPGELLLRLDARIRHILVDEFQDTSTSQFQLLHTLLEGWEEHNATGEPQQTLFIVGDGMQSIYGFRAANVGLFLGAKNHGINGVPLSAAPLRVNFRSTPTIVEWVNRVFAHAFPAEENIARGAVPYEASTAFQDDRASSAVRIVGVPDDPAREREAAQCVELIRQSLRDTEGDIAILVRNRNHLRAIVPALGAAGIAWRAADIDPLAARTAVRDLLALYRAMTNPADRIAWLALLRTPLIGLDNADLQRLVAGADGRQAQRSIWARMADAASHAVLSAEGQAALARAVACLAPTLAQRERKSRRSWLEGAWLALGGMLCLAGDDDWRDVQALFGLIEALPGDADSAQLEARVAQLYAKPPAQAGARLWLMTIHKSKGLEFETVIIPGLERAPRSDDKALLLWNEYLGDAAEGGETGLVLAANAAFGGQTDPIYEWLDHERRQKQRLEDTRLFYVAATRAISRLYLLFCDNRADRDKPFSPGSRSLLARIWPAVADDVDWLDGTQPIAVRAASARDSEEMLWRVPPDWRLPGVIDVAAVSPVDSGHGNTPEPSQADTDEVWIGTLVHKLFEQCVRFGADHWRRRDAASQRSWAAAQLRQHGIAADRHAAIIDAVMQCTQAALADAQGRWLLDTAHAESHVEWELWLDDGRSIRIDRSFVDGDGTRWIVDYKTARPQPGEALADFLQRETQSHRAQLLSYRDAVAAIADEPLRLALYFPAVPAWCEV
jgi:ATP-dependent exoDNAse (exonuclease V) beta subunit